MTLPIHQRKGYGNLLIDFSYLLTRVEKRTGTPEKPMSDLGLVSYRNYWKLTLCYDLRNQRDPLSITDISLRTGMTVDDIISGLEVLSALVRDPVTGYYALRLDHALFEDMIERWEAKGYIKLNPKALIWSPYITGPFQEGNLGSIPRSTIGPWTKEVPGEALGNDAVNGNPSLEDPNSMDIDPALDGFDAAKVGPWREEVPRESPRNDAENGNPELADPNLDTDPALGGFDAANGDLAATNRDSAQQSSTSPGSPHPTQQPSPKNKQPDILHPLHPILTKILEIPPTRFEVVPPPTGTSGRRRVPKAAGRGRGRSRPTSHDVRGLGEGDSIQMERVGRGRTHQNERLAPESLPASATTRTNKRIVAKAPRIRSRTAKTTRARSRSAEGSLLQQGKGISESTSSVDAGVASTVLPSSVIYISSGSSSGSSFSDGN